MCVCVCVCVCIYIYIYINLVPALVDPLRSDPFLAPLRLRACARSEFGVRVEGSGLGFRA